MAKRIVCDGYGSLGCSIQQAITLDPALPALALEASYEGEYVRFYFAFYDDEGEGGEWSYWTSETADATATNHYYTGAEIRALLAEHGFKADRDQA